MVSREVVNLVQIDDSGSGSLLGGTCIGAVRMETGEYVYDFIPVEYYHSELFSGKEYLRKSNQIVFSLLDRLDRQPDELILICRGYMFELTRKMFDRKKIPYVSTKIENPLQDLIEETFKSYALSLGLPPQYVKYTKYPLHFHRILRWVYADYDKRAPLCKTGWKSWSKYASLNIKENDDIILSNNYVCLKCGMNIRKGTKVKRLEYVSNCPNTIYLHRHC